MFWNKKNKKSVGTLPELKRGPQAIPSMKDYSRIPPPMDFSHDVESQEKKEIHGLPSFPDSPMKKGFSQSAIKDAVETEDIKEEHLHPPELHTENEPLEHLPPLPKEKRTMEMEEWKPSSQTPKIPTGKTTGNKPVFVRLDKFNTARESLENIKTGLSDIDELLHTIREVKMKEDQEISSWEKEIESIKARINTISANVFDVESY